jgi:uncharacterized OB-fold protein
MEKAKKQILIGAEFVHAPTSPDDRPYLIGSKCSICGMVIFPKGKVCPRCLADGCMEEHHIKGKGKLNTFAIVYAAIPGFKAPSIQAYVDLEEGPRIWSLLTGVEPDPARLNIGMDLELVIGKLREDEQGAELVSYHFTPARESRMRG